MTASTLRVAVVGAGPSGFYTADALTRQDEQPVQVDLIERLPTPFGLVRAGIAPDHQAIKKVDRAFSRVAARPSVRFLGNVSLGTDVSIAELREHYDAIVYAIGSPRGRTLDLPGADADGVFTACALVYWYNGHPDHTHHRFHLDRVRRAMVIGVGNVAVDVVRVLTRDRDALAATDIADHALGCLRRSPLEEVVLVGRRGPAQAAFTPKELAELVALPEVDVRVSPRDAEMDPASCAQLSDHASRENARLMLSLAGHPPSGAPRRVRILTRTSPVRCLVEGGRLVGVSLVRNRLIEQDGQIQPVATEETWTEPCDALFFSIGYMGLPIPGLPLDPRQEAVRNEGGRVRPGEYVTGWARRGPTGLLGANRPDGKEIAARVLAEVAPSDAARPDLLETLSARGVPVVRFADWERLDAEERRLGAASGRPRQKVTDRATMLRLMGVG